MRYVCVCGSLLPAAACLSRTVCFLPRHNVTMREVFVTLIDIQSSADDMHEKKKSYL